MTYGGAKVYVHAINLGTEWSASYPRRLSAGGRPTPRWSLGKRLYKREQFLSLMGNEPRLQPVVLCSGIQPGVREDILGGT
jgi:hypothetical protein